jgi:hypothetical protein
LITIVVAVVVTYMPVELPAIPAAFESPAVTTQNGALVIVAPKVSVTVVCEVVEVVIEPAVSVEPVPSVALPAPDSARLELLKAVPLWATFI